MSQLVNKQINFIYQYDVKLLFFSFFKQSATSVMRPGPQSSSPSSPSPTQLAVSLPGVALSAPIKAAVFSEMTEHPARHLRAWGCPKTESSRRTRGGKGSQVVKLVEQLRDR